MLAINMTKFTENVQTLREAHQESAYPKDRRTAEAISPILLKQKERSESPRIKSRIVERDRTENILETGNINRVIRHIEVVDRRPREQLRNFLIALSQTLSSQGACRGYCAGVLKERIIEFVSIVGSTETQGVIESGGFSHNSDLVEIISEIKYSLSPKSKKYYHQLDKIFKENLYSASVFIIGGVTLGVSGGITQIFSSDPNVHKSGFILMGSGIVLASTPFLAAARLTYTGKP